ncbi:MAG: ATP-binding cassette domain-containing protein [Prevotellaceae bacterium]|nr:ATP-binding cassette domain-containing protein [Prevotellaceae bacterium]
MNDIILSSLLNIFALFCEKDKTDSDVSNKILTNYLVHQFGVRDLESSLDFFNDLRSFYVGMPEDELDSMVSDICAKLPGKITAEEQALMLLRLMEICTVETHKVDDKATFKIIADTFNVTNEEFDGMVAFVEEDAKSDLVKIRPYSEGTLRTLYLERLNLVVFIYDGKGTVTMNDVPLVPGTFQIWQRSGVMKSHKDKTLYYFNAMQPHKAEEVARPQIKLRGNHIDFRFSEGGDNGMHDFTFNLYGGELVAIMGGSGVGKSTLLSLLNGSLRPQTGGVAINGHDISEKEAKNLIGFVPQDDLLIEELTVYQNLWFTARLCFDGMPDEEIDKRVMTMLHELGLEASKDLKVGSAINKYISGGQRKRLNIALELIREPAILFLDEPTSGLSSADTETVVNLLKEQAFKGRLIVANIHQPSSDVFKLFDRLWVLDKGGYPIYDGNPIEAVTYFKKAANYADADISTCPTCGNVNPEVILNIIDERVLSETGEQTDMRKKTPKEWHELYLQTAPKSKTKVEDLPPSDQRRPNALKQIGIFLHRNMMAKKTNLQYLLITLLEAPVLAFICALLTKYTPLEGYSIMNNQNLVSYYFMAVIVATFLGMSGSAEEIIKDRALLKREKFLQLNQKSYIWSKIIFMGIVALVQTLLFLIVGNTVMEITDMFFTWWMILFVTAFLAALTGLLLSQCMSSVVAIYITIPILLIPQILLCGLVVDFADLTPKSTTRNVPVIGDVIPSRWAFEALAVTSFTDNDYEKNFFDQDKERYTASYYSHSYLDEIESQLETMQSKKQRGKSQEEIDAHMTVIKNSLPVVLDICGMEPYDGDYSYESLKATCKAAEKVLDKRSNTTTLALDRKVAAMIRAIGKDQVAQLKKDHFNKQLESFVLNSSAENLCQVVDGHIVINAGFAFVPPLSHNGRAPFYSSEKILGDWHVKTLWFNIAVMIIMGIIVSLCLLYDCPGRYVRKERN